MLSSLPLFLRLLRLFVKLLSERGCELKRLSLAVVSFLAVPVVAFAWTPLVSSGDFDGIKIDVVTAATGIIAVGVIVLGAFLIMRAMSH